MTHWMVRVSTFIQDINRLIMDSYLNDKRKFVEQGISFAICFAIGMFVLLNIVLPIPKIPKPTVEESTWQVLKGTYPQFLHLFAILGVFGFMSSGTRVFYLQIHMVFSVIIKLRNAIHAVRKSQEGIMQ